MNMQDIFSEDIGSGTSLVLVHGFLGSSEMWGPQIKFFKDKKNSDLLFEFHVIL